MLAKTPLREQMIAWLETKDPEESYEWDDFKYCACGQWAMTKGQADLLISWRAYVLSRFQVDADLSTDYGEGDEEWHALNEEWHALNRAAEQVRTFGQLLKRLRNLPA